MRGFSRMVFYARILLASRSDRSRTDRLQRGAKQPFFALALNLCIAGLLALFSISAAPQSQPEQPASPQDMPAAQAQHSAGAGQSLGAYLPGDSSLPSECTQSIRVRFHSQARVVAQFGGVVLRETGTNPVARHPSELEAGAAGSD